MLPEFARRVWASAKNDKSSFIPRTATFPVVPLCHKNNEGQPVLPGGPALREHVSVCAESHAVSEGCRAVAAYLHKTDVRDLHNGDVAFLVETRNWESREP